jgi:hypothetical protein
MSRPAFVRADTAVLAAQIGVAALSLGAMVWAPPARGDMLLLPLRPGAPAVEGALSAGASLMARGPGGAPVVRGDRAALFWPLLAQGVLAIAAAPTGCGTPRA